MSYTIVTDVFCDGQDCPEWTHGATGSKPEKKEANANVRAQGWMIIKRKHYCPTCYADRESKS